MLHAGQTYETRRIQRDSAPLNMHIFRLAVTLWLAFYLLHGFIEIKADNRHYIDYTKATSLIVADTKFYIADSRENYIYTWRDMLSAGIRSFYFIMKHSIIVLMTVIKNDVTTFY